MKLMRCVTRALFKNAGKLLDFIPGAEFAYNVAVDSWENLRQEGLDAVGQRDLEALLQAGPPAIAEAVAAEAGNAPPEQREAVANYLTMMPAAARQSLRRPSDPTGNTVPAQLRVTSSSQLAALLPQRPSRFHAGSRPIMGVDLELVELLGVGGFGEVWKARHVFLRSRPAVALKFCLDPTARRSLGNEAGVLERLMQEGRHPGIVPLQNTYLSSDPPALEYELVEGGDLAGLLRDPAVRGQLTPERVTQLFSQVVKAVAFAHRLSPPIVHCDLKPINVLCQRTERGVRLRVTDFGIGGLARADQPAQTNRPDLITEAVRGAYTPLYASPQQRVRSPEQPPDPRDDVHALGVIWYQLLTGQVDLLEVPKDWYRACRRLLPPGHFELLEACLATGEQDRPKDAGMLLTALQTEQPAASPMVAAPPVTTAASPPPLTPPPVTSSPPAPPHQPANTPLVHSPARGLGPVTPAVPTLLKSWIGSRFHWCQNVSFSPDGKTLATAGLDGAAMWDASSGDALFRFEDKTTHSVALFTPDGTRMLSGDRGGGVRMWEVTSKRLVTSLKCGATVSDLAVSSDGRLLIAGPGNDALLFRLTADGLDPITRLQGHTAGVNTVSFSPDGRTAVTAALDGTCRLWAIPDGVPLVTLTGHRSEQVMGAVFSPDGLTVVSYAWDWTVRFWRTTNGSCQATMPVEAGINRLAFHPSGRFIAAPSSRGYVDFIDFGTGAASLKMAVPGEPGREHANTVFAADFSRDGRHLAVVTMCGMVKVYDTTNLR